MATDDMIGHLEQELQVKGIADNTYFVFSSDNGYHMGEYRFLPGKQTAFDTDIHVPLILSGPGVKAASTSTALTSNIDFAPTFESLTGATIGSTVDGVSMTPIWHGQTPGTWPEAVLVEHHGPDNAPSDPDVQTKAGANPPSYEAIRTAIALYVRYTDGQSEYYNTTTDPTGTAQPRRRSRTHHTHRSPHRTTKLPYRHYLGRRPPMSMAHRGPARQGEAMASCSGIRPGSLGVAVFIR